MHDWDEVLKALESLCTKRLLFDKNNDEVDVGIIAQKTSTANV